MLQTLSLRIIMQCVLPVVLMLNVVRAMDTGPPSLPSTTLTFTLALPSPSLTVVAIGNRLISTPASFEDFSKQNSVLVSYLY